MTEFNGKTICEGSLDWGNDCRRTYLDGILRFVDAKYAESAGKRDAFMDKDLVREQETYRRRYMEMIGEPVVPYPASVPEARTTALGKDDFGEIFSVQIQTLPDLWFYGLLLVPHQVRRAPLVIAQHGGGSMPEICCDFLGESVYGYFTKRALERGMVVFAPQLLLWKFDQDTSVQKFRIDLPFDRGGIDSKLRQLGLSITGLEVFCIRRAIDYLHTLDYVDGSRTAMMGLSYGGYYSLHTAAADTRIRSVYAAGFFNDRTRIAFGDWRYANAANTFCDAEVAALVAPRRLQIDVGKTDALFDYIPSVEESRRAAGYYARFDASAQFRYTLWEGGHRFDESGSGFDFFFDGI